MMSQLVCDDIMHWDIAHHNDLCLPVENHTHLGILNKSITYAIIISENMDVSLSPFLPYSLKPPPLLTHSLSLTNIHMHTGWIDRAVLIPVMKACFTYSLPEKEIRTLLNGSTLKSMASLSTKMYYNSNWLCVHVMYTTVLQEHTVTCNSPLQLR